VEQVRHQLLESLWGLASGVSAAAVTPAVRLTDDEALALQLEVLDRWIGRGDGPGGWKVGFTSGASRAAAPAGLRPFGFILKSRVLPSGSKIERARIRGPGVENELCFVMADHLAGAAVTATDARAAIRGVAPAFEINESRLGPEADIALRIADDLSQWGVVVGTLVVPAPSKATLDALTVELSKDGEAVQRQVADGHIDDHFESIASLARLLARFDRGLRPGDHIITGAYTRQRIDAGGRWRGRFSGIGSVDVEFV